VAQNNTAQGDNKTYRKHEHLQSNRYVFKTNPSGGK